MVSCLPGSLSHICEFQPHSFWPQSVWISSHPPAPRALGTESCSGVMGHLVAIPWALQEALDQKASADLNSLPEMN